MRIIFIMTKEFVGRCQYTINKTSKVFFSVITIVFGQFLTLVLKTYGLPTFVKRASWLHWQGDTTIVGRDAKAALLRLTHICWLHWQGDAVLLQVEMLKLLLFGLLMLWWCSSSKLLVVAIQGSVASVRTETPQEGGELGISKTNRILHKLKPTQFYLDVHYGFPKCDYL